MALTATQLSAISRLFSPSIFKELAQKGRSPLFARLYSDSGLAIATPHNQTLSDTFDQAFTILRKSGHRNEYIYRSAITHNILLGKHSLNSASMLTEFRIGDSKADLVILNGTATVYEIKSERDSLYRLNKQITDYKKVFAKCYVISAKSHLQDVIENTPEDVGIMSLNRWNRIQTIREATDHSEFICPKTTFESLRVNEAQEVLVNLNYDIPNTTNIRLRANMLDIFKTIEPRSLHHEVVNILKKTRNLSSLNTFVDRLPSSLKPIALSTRIPLSNHLKLIDTLNLPVGITADWI